MTFPLVPVDPTIPEEAFQLSQDHYGAITSNEMLNTVDGPDVDAFPDLTKVSGVIVFTPTIKVLGFVGADHSETGSIAMTPITATVGKDGKIYTTLQNGLVVKGVYLIATDLTCTNRKPWNYKVSFFLKDQAGRSIVRKSFLINVKAGQTVPLASLEPVEASDGTLIVQGPTGAKGDAGMSAYELWLSKGFTGSEEEYLASQKGADSTVPGPPGPPGEDGKDSTVPGPAPVIDVGNVYSLPYGSQPVVEVRGAGPYLLDIGLPLPKDGADSTVPGPVGPAGFNFRNVWDPTVDYVNNDLVNYDGNQWFAYGDPDVGEVPSASSYHWYMFLAHGADGQPGAPGKDSMVPGPPGPAPTMQMGTITRLPYGSTPTATISGTNPYTISMAIPDGATGPAGPANTLSIGSVIGTPAGTAPKATITGTAPNQTISFELPAGAKGDKGDPGAAGTGTSAAVESFTLGSTTAPSVGDSGSTYLAATTTLTVRKEMRVASISFRAVEAGDYQLVIDGLAVGGAVVTATAGADAKFANLAWKFAPGTYTVGFNMIATARRVHYSATASILYKNEFADFTASGWSQFGGSYTIPFIYEIVYPAAISRLSDVSKTAPTSGQVLTYDTGTTLWTPTSINQESSWIKVPASAPAGENVATVQGIYVKRLKSDVKIYVRGMQVQKGWKTFYLLNKYFNYTPIVPGGGGNGLGFVVPKDATSPTAMTGSHGVLQLSHINTQYFAMKVQDDTADGVTTTLTQPTDFYITYPAATDWVEAIPSIMTNFGTPVSGLSV